MFLLVCAETLFRWRHNNISFKKVTSLLLWLLWPLALLLCARYSLIQNTYIVKIDWLSNSNQARQSELYSSNLFGRVMVNLLPIDVMWKALLKGTLGRIAKHAPSFTSLINGTEQPICEAPPQVYFIVFTTGKRCSKIAICSWQKHSWVQAWFLNVTKYKISAMLFSKSINESVRLNFFE